MLGVCTLPTKMNGKQSVWGTYSIAWRAALGWLLRGSGTCLPHLSQHCHCSASCPGDHSQPCTPPSNTHPGHHKIKHRAWFREGARESGARVFAVSIAHLVDRTPTFRPCIELGLVRVPKLCVRAKVPPSVVSEHLQHCIVRRQYVPRSLEEA